ncbi:hypothetical protein KZ829_39020 [Actinoplanes hulinensis]|uniref:DUF4386 family protein n=1 Tax=Actinoplanes hulinensis TaxID=1144547 RepID=A0ABS7BFU1_9ACTN|nr:hypothetical protein [Actinoplanes hulinensis]MBW6439739.1 hypothetical protein [Actinoplanes hulinensis]
MVHLPARATAYLATAMGVAHAVLYLWAYWIMWQAPAADASAAELAAFYGGGHGAWVLAVGVYLLPLAAIAFVWFTVTVRMWVAVHGRPEHFLFSNLQVVSGILYAALLLVAAAAFSVNSALAELSSEPVDPSRFAGFPQFGLVVTVLLGSRMAGIFVLTTASIGRHTGLIPAWFVWPSYLVGLLLLLMATFNSAFVLLFPTWMMALVILLILRVRHAAPQTPARQPG